MFLDAKCIILLKHTSDCGPPCPRLFFQQSLFERGLCGAAPSQHHLIPPCDPHIWLWGEDQQCKRSRDLQRQRNMLQLTAEPGKPGSPGSPCKESGDELPWGRTAFPLEMEIAVGDTYSCGRGEKRTSGDLSAAAVGGGIPSRMVGSPKHLIWATEWSSTSPLTISGA